MIHATAIVDIPDLDSSTNVWAYAHVMAGAVIGKQVNIGDHAFVEGGAKIGDNVTIKNYVCVWGGHHHRGQCLCGSQSDVHQRSLASLGTNALSKSAIRAP